MITRRGFVQGALGAGAMLSMGWGGGMQAESPKSTSRRYHFSLAIDAIEKDPDLLDVVSRAGVSEVWLSCFFQGNWHHSIEKVLEYKAKVEAKGMAARNITIPFGHPSWTPVTPDYMPKVDTGRWKSGRRFNGKEYWGVSLHPPITIENVEAIKTIKMASPGTIFLDDDFRLAMGPGDIGGCYCEDHKKRFLESHGLKEGDWQELLDSVGKRSLNKITRSWVEWTCDELTGCFKAQQSAALPEVQLGIMVMYLGSEKAGIRLKDYQGVPFRVGELMFDDNSFNPVKGKTNELFSVLFHRRYASTDWAYSETTAWPADKLSAKNMAAKLVISTIADVRNTMFMSGLITFPKTHWETLAPAMKKNAAIHEKIAGHALKGPLKHYWGTGNRYVGNDNPFSLFLAMGIPFEATDSLGADGWTFLNEFDAALVQSGELKSEGSKLVARSGADVKLDSAQILEESLPAMFEWKKQVLPQIGEVPYVAEDKPAVCAWRPSCQSVLVWNLSEAAEELTVKYKGREHKLQVNGLDGELLDLEG